MRTLLITIISLSFFNVSAESEKVKYKNKERATGKRVVLFVGDCTLDNDHLTDLDGNTIYRDQAYKVQYQVCEEFITYQVKVTGTFWDSDSTIVPGSESAPYVRSRTATKTFTGNTSFTNRDGSLGELVRETAGFAQSLISCRQQKDLLEQQANLDRRSNLFQVCAQ